MKMWKQRKTMEILRSASVNTTFFYCKTKNIANPIDFVTLLTHSKRQGNKYIFLF